MPVLHKKITKIFSAIIIIVLTFTSCASGTGAVDSFSLMNRDVKTGFSDISLHSSALKDFSFVASSGLVELYFDKETTSVAVYDTSQQVFWTALPFFSSGSAAVVNLKLTDSSNIYYLNSQDNSVAFSSYSTEFTSDSVKVTYYMSDNVQTVNKPVSSLDDGEVYAVVPVVYTLRDGNFTVSIDASDLFVANGFMIESLSILPYFGAVSYTAEALEAENKFNAEKEISGAESQTDKSGNEETVEKDIDLTEDFLLVPDGCGAVMYTAMQDSATESVSFDVYGNENNSSENTAVLGAFGIKNGAAAFVAVIEEGEALATVRAFRDTANSDKVNIVYADFAVNPHIETSSKIYFSERYNGEIRISYRFMSSSEANYISMAASCREALIRNGTLSSKSVSSDELPLNISVIGSVNGSSSKKTTDFEEAEDILAVLKAKGVNSINLIFNGIFTGGFRQKKASSAKILSNLGGASSFEILSEYAAKQGVNVFAGVNILSAESLSVFDRAQSLNGGKIEYSTVNPLETQTEKNQFSLEVLSASKVEKNIIALMNKMKNINFSGFCINDAANLLFGDYSQTSMNSSLVAQLLSDDISALSTQNNLILSGANFYALKSASMLVDVPFYTQYEESTAYSAIPFVMAILHSTVEYSGQSANTCAVPKLEMLKCIEYGGVPYFTLVYDSSSQFYYGNFINEIAEFALRTSSELSDLISARIEAHYLVEDGVYCTSYDNGAVVYVNYNNYSVNVGDISVLPYDYLRIN